MKLQYYKKKSKINYSAIIVANGDSKRFGSENKLLKKLKSSNVLIEAIKPFLKNNFIDQIIIVCPKEIENVILDYFAVKNWAIDRLQFSRGGSERYLSVQKGMHYVKNNFVLIHDGARPYLSNELLDKIMLNLINNDAVIPSLTINSALKQKNTSGDFIHVNRNDFLITQTPQGFKTKIYDNALKRNKPNNYNYDDDATFIELNSPEIKMIYINGDIKNIKITNKEDIF
ncbi:2-C-methyl-D-erythritol 4-phosphate cytidylyltransferase [Spiroplasma endosymbiont of Labia minor]|uniref:2-C-methyl-D-erythritol 4-phosphate cytidylyltransferase n=1 Tax=Spiroplasma endosymbiont of Labia minor TaxID=3066305 RepID=UPI0030D5FAD0